jgi:hypothetical protein
LGAPPAFLFQLIKLSSAAGARAGRSGIGVSMKETVSSAIAATRPEWATVFWTLCPDWAVS